MNKIIFIINTIPNQRCIKRINEFIENGYDIRAYSFVRENISFSQPKKFNIEVVGTFKTEGGYKNRVSVIIRAIKQIQNNHKNDPSVLYYYFGLDIAMFATFFIKNKYFYEVSDLSQTYIDNFFLKKLLNLVDRKIIKKSFETIFTSDGFREYHYGFGASPRNITIIPNRVNKDCLKFNPKNKRIINIQKIKFGFVGLIRYNSILNFARCIGDYFPQHEFHFYGNPINNNLELTFLSNKSNIFFHGEFENPSDLPAIYQSFDLVLSTYDINIDNVKFAEPNKLYEATFFNTPIIVSRDTFLADKVERLGIGYCINALNNTEVIKFIKNLTEKDINLKLMKCKKLPKSFSIDDNKSFFDKIELKLTRPLI